MAPMAEPGARLTRRPIDLGDTGSIGFRRPIAARRMRWIAALARSLQAAGVRPNQVSVMSVLFATSAGVALIVGLQGPTVARMTGLLVAGCCIQARLLCNVLDGLLAIEGGLRTKSGAIFNELPDRFSDAAILVCAGYAVPDIAWASALGWAAAWLAALTAYVRALGGASGAAQDFSGPMAKQQRMAVLTVACVLAAALAGTPWVGRLLLAALLVVVTGSAITVSRRTLHIIRELERS
jgi:phosphatidylglycerophosphate synthase